MANTLQYKKEFCELLIKHMSMGLSFRSFSAVAKVTRTTLYDWVDKYPEFKEAKEMGEDNALLFLEKRLMAKASGQDLKEQGINTKLIDLGAICFPLKTRFHQLYGDRSKVETTHDISDDAKKLVINLND